MKIDKKIYENSLLQSIPALSKKYDKGLRGLESIIQENLCKSLKKSFVIEEQKSLTDLGGKNLWENIRTPQIDIFITKHSHALELKVVRMPNKKHAAINQRLYDIGQISSDYWRLKYAEKIKSAELGILLCGPLVWDFDGPKHVLREFHNRMFLDYMVSNMWGELKTELTPSSNKYKQRKCQVEAIKEMGFSKPFYDLPENWMIFTNDRFAYVSIPVE